MPIFEQGYKHWDGELSGHTWRWWTIARQGVRVALQGWGLRILTLMAMTPAVALVGVFVLWGFLEQQAEWIMPIARSIFPPEVASDPAGFRVIVWTLAFHFFFKLELFIAMLLVLIVGPGLISQDLRFNAIPLYFSRPLYRWDYFLGKLGVIAFFLALVAVVPALLGYLLGILFSFKLDVIRDTWHLVPGCLGYGLLIVLSAGTLMLALSSLSRSSRYVAAFWIGIWFLSSTVAGVMSTIHVTQTVHAELRQVPQDPPPRWDPNDPQAAENFRQWQVRQQQMNRRFDWQRRRNLEMSAYLNDWRPIISYTNNLDRVGRVLLDVDTIAIRFANEVLPAQTPEEAKTAARYFLSGPQYPWYWSASILLVLFGASLWLLTTRVRTLDRLS
jgi:ABC-2 type transport system permease protein